MEWKTFVIELTKPLAWPITVLLLSLIFRRHLLVLVEKAAEADESEFNFGKWFSLTIRRTKQMADKVLPKELPFEAEFAEADQSVSPPEKKASAAAPSVSETYRSSMITPEDSVRWAKIRWLARHKPREAVLEAGLAVRNEAIAALKRHISADENLELVTERSIGDLLVQHKIIDYGQFGILLQVLRMRDGALFKDDFRIKVEDAYVYVNMASKLFLVLRESCTK